eukprot:CAMPEP_0185024520 /NCGR_PEP_ID=MMETSP1103-20130426/7625_1 /TAXON_ID=36769 /ORGANISM="Paraphysomonas bandaiensis, Strain Caron Lab Isolate" /LENGTH=1049 /DNA_ID=CAMNT_0027557515 /DNA_START=348 /DNA_END=3500 /DNA_ORIENTATION=+
MMVDIRSWKDGTDVWSIQALMDPPDSVPAEVELDDDGNELMVYDGSAYGFWISGTGTLKTGVIFAVTAPQDIIFYPDEYTRLNRSGSVYMYRGEYSQWTNTQKLIPDVPQRNAFFGDSVMMCPKIPTNMVIGAHGDNSKGPLLAGAAYVYRSTPTGRYWTQSQKLHASDYAQQDWFGFRVGIYDEFLMVSAQKDDDNGIETGAVYVFREERAEGLYQWSQQQKLLSTRDDSTWFGEYLSLHQHTLVVGVPFERTNRGTAYVFKTYKTPEIPYHKPHPHPHRTLTDCNFTDSNFTDGNYTDGNYTDDDDNGHCHHHHHHPKPKPKPKPMFKWWSLQQKLYPSDPHTFRNFGSYTSTYGNGGLIAVGAYGEAFGDTDWDDDTSDNYRSGSAYIFVKDDKYDRWSQQQKFISPTPAKGEYFSDPYLHGSDLIIRNTVLGYKYSDKFDWDCLLVSVSDHFGDGWDGAYLIAYAPGSNTKLTDHYAPFCDSENPLQLRYCPLMVEDEGEYLFEISHDVLTKKFSSEIRFEIYNEKDGKYYYGDIETSIKFRWDSTERHFDHLLSKEDKLVKNDKCQACPVKPSPKPVLPHRELKGGKSSTSSPTISPAPTLSQGDTLDWNVMQMATTEPDGWFGVGDYKNGTGMSWYIYDGNGKKLIYTGTLCNGLGLSYDCPLVLPDGDYILRFGGALDAVAGSHSWTFCGRSGGDTEMLVFSVVNRQCIAYSQATAAEYCSDELSLTLLVSGTVQLQGISAVEQLSANDFAVIGDAMMHLSPVSAKDSSASFVRYDDGLVVKFTIYIDMKALGYTSSNTDDCMEVFDMVSDALWSASESGRLASEVVISSSTLQSDSNVMSKLKDIKLLTVVNEGPQFHRVPAVTSSDTSSSVKDTNTDHLKEHLSTEQVVLETTMQIESNIGYAIAAMAAVLAAGVAWRISVRENVKTRRPFKGTFSGAVSEESASLSSHLLDSSQEESLRPNSKKLCREGVDSESVALSRKAGDSSPSYSSSRKAKSMWVMSALASMKEDLKEMAAIEDNSLKRSDITEDMDTLLRHSRA